MSNHVIPNILLSVLAGLALTACGSSGGASTGTASFAATDAPVDNVTGVQVTFDAIALQPQDGERIMIEFDEPRVIPNLLDLQGTDSALILDDTEVPAGQYNFVRLFVVPNDPNSFVEEDDGARQNLIIPGQQGNGNNRRFLQLSSGFTVPAGGNVDFTIDFQLRQALTQPLGQNGDYLLRPSLRLINNVEVGTVVGTVDSSLVNDASCTNDLAANAGAGEGNAVYLYTGVDAVVGDVNLDASGDPDHASDDSDGDVDEVNPLTAANVVLNTTSGNYEYTVGFVAEGAYSIAFTCQSLTDEPETDEATVFVQPSNISVVADQTTTQDFVAEPVTTPQTGT